MKRIRLGVNVDHVASIRQARGTLYPDPVEAAALAERAGADQITIHLREDRRHIQERDLRLLRQTVHTPLNLELAANEDVLRIACEVRPDMATLVPERRMERTTEGGLAVAGHEDAVKAVVARLQNAGIAVSLFIAPDPEEVEASARCGATQVELHTGFYADVPPSGRDVQFNRVVEAGRAATDLGLILAAGHGLDYENVRPLCGIHGLEEFNIGHAIVARALFVGIQQAVRQMIEAIAAGVGPV